MKKVLIVLAGLIIVLCYLFHSKAAQEQADEFIKSNETHEQQLLQDFMRQ